MQDVKYVGMIRTPSFLKAIGMFTPEGISLIQGHRETQQECRMTRLLKNNVPYFKRRDKWSKEYELDWNGPGVFDPGVVRTKIETGKLGDFIIEKVVYSFTSPAVVDMLNDLVALTCKGKSVGQIATGERLVATFERNFDQDLKLLQPAYLQMLNANEINNYKFKVSCLDLTDLHTARVEKYGEKEHIDLSCDAKLIREVLRSALDWNGWPMEERRIQNKKGEEETPKPVAIRQYIMADKRRWSLKGQEELNGI